MTETSEILSKTQFELLKYLKSNPKWHAQKDLIERFNAWSKDLRLTHTSLMSSLSKFKDYSFIEVLAISKFNFIRFNENSVSRYCQLVSNLKSCEDNVRRATVEDARVIIPKIGNGLTTQELDRIYNSLNIQT